MKNKMETEIKVGTNLYRYVPSENGFIEKYVVSYVEEHPDDEDIKPYFGVMKEKEYENIEEKHRLSFSYKTRNLKEFIAYHSIPLDFDNYRECGYFLSPGMAINNRIKVFKNHIKKLKEVYRNYINDEKI
jgi:glutaredoxin-related protein